MNNKKLIDEICNTIDLLNQKSSNLIEIINTIDFQMCNDTDNEVLNYVSTYYNDMLNMKQSNNNVMIKVRKKLTQMY